MSDQTWARVSLRIVSRRLTVSEIGQMVGAESSAAADKSWAVDLTTDNAVSLDEQLLVLKQFLREKAEVLGSLRDCEVSVSISWTPRNPQDGIAMDLDLIMLLSEARCYVLLDTYLG
jgi:hypothetical protein